MIAAPADETASPSMSAARDRPDRDDDDDDDDDYDSGGSLHGGVTILSSADPSTTTTTTTTNTTNANTNATAELSLGPSMVDLSALLLLPPPSSCMSSSSSSSLPPESISLERRRRRRRGSRRRARPSTSSTSTSPPRSLYPPPSYSSFEDRDNGDEGEASSSIIPLTSAVSPPPPHTHSHRGLAATTTPAKDVDRAHVPPASSSSSSSDAPDAAITAATAAAARGGSATGGEGGGGAGWWWERLRTDGEWDAFRADADDYIEALVAASSAAAAAAAGRGGPSFSAGWLRGMLESLDATLSGGVDRAVDVPSSSARASPRTGCHASHLVGEMLDIRRRLGERCPPPPRRGWGATTAPHRRRNELLAEYARCRERLLAAIVGAEEECLHGFEDADNCDDVRQRDDDNSLGGINDDGYVEVVGALSSRWDRCCADGSIDDVPPLRTGKCQVVTLAAAALFAGLTWGAGILLALQRTRCR